MTTDPAAVATDFYATIQSAWNDADGPAFGAAFGAVTDFVDIRGVHHHGGPAEIGESHQGIFDSIYKSSVIRYDLQGARVLGDDVVVANGHATLDCPDGPLKGVNEAVSTIVMVPVHDEWKTIRFQNTLVTA